MRRSARLALWTAAWTLFQWWAVIGWPDTLEGARAALLITSIGSSVTLMAYHAVRARAR